MYPAIAGQFGGASMGSLRSAFKALGFAGMVEVALFADILTLKEALTFDRNIRTDSDYMLTSCCCPIWIAMVRRANAKSLAMLLVFQLAFDYVSSYLLNPYGIQQPLLKANCEKFTYPTLFWWTKDGRCGPAPASGARPTASSAA